MHIDKNIVFNRPTKKPILIDTFLPENKIKLPVVIFCHGYKGYKDWGAWNLMADYIASQGFCFIKFNFSHNGGTINEPIDFTDLEAFGNNNYIKELDDLGDVIDWTQERFKNTASVNTNTIIVIGHSRGGGIALIKAKEDNRIKGLVSLASVSDYKSRFIKGDALKKWQDNGVYYIENGRTKQKMPLYFQFFTNFLKNEDRLYIKKSAQKLSIPHLILHGDKDTSVHLSESLNLHEWHPKSQLEIIENADHVFNTKQPWTENEMSLELKLVSEIIISFLDSNF